jgi:hypothetical protein
MRAARSRRRCSAEKPAMPSGGRTGDLRIMIHRNLILAACPALWCPGDGRRTHRRRSACARPTALQGLSVTGAGRSRLWRWRHRRTNRRTGPSPMRYCSSRATPALRGRTLPGRSLRSDYRIRRRRRVHVPDRGRGQTRQTVPWSRPRPEKASPLPRSEATLDQGYRKDSA